MIGALIGAGSSLLGGLFGRNAEKKATAAQNEYNKPINVRARAEEGGFNPLLWAGQGNIQTQASGGGAILGNAIANAGLAIADGLTSEKKLKIERERLAMDKKRLEKLIQNATIRPRVGGIYSGNRSTPRLSNRPSVGAGAAGAKRALQFPVGKPFEVENGSGGVDYAGNPVTNLSTPFGVWEVDPQSSDAEMVETRYGDIAQEIVGVSTMMVDAKKNIYDPFAINYQKKKAANASQRERNEREKWEVEKQNRRNEVARKRKHSGGKPLVIGPVSSYKPKRRYSSTLTSAQ